MQDVVVLHRYGDGDYSAWSVTLPDEIFEGYETSGCSVRGPLETVLNYTVEELNHIKK